MHRKRSEEEARKREIELAGTRSSDLSANLREGITGKATDKAAEMFGIYGGKPLRQLVAQAVAGKPLRELVPQAVAGKPLTPLVAEPVLGEARIKTAELFGINQYSNSVHLNNVHLSPREKVPYPSKGKATEKAAELFGINKYSRGTIYVLLVRVYFWAYD